MFALFEEPQVPNRTWRFDSKRVGVGSRLQNLEPEPESWRSRVESNLESRDSCRGLPTTTAATTTTAGNGISTPTPTQAGMVGNCNSFHMVVSDDTCATIASEAGISTTDFYSWNSGVGSGCSSLWLGYYVCTGVIGSTPTTTKKTTTSTGNGVTTPTPTQPGIVSNCNKFHEVVSGDGCQAIANAAGITWAQFEAWNTQAGSNCSTLWLGYYVCIGILWLDPHVPRRD